jgi:hypothetical protein
MLDYLSGASLWVDFTTERGKVVAYTIVLLVETQEGTEVVRLYDAAHGYNEMHRYGRLSGKQSGINFYSGSLGEGMLVALTGVEGGYVEMIEGWRRG